MRVYVNEKGIDLPAGMTVRHALLAAGIDASATACLTVRDEWSNEVGLRGALSEGLRLFIGESDTSGICRQENPAS